MTRQIFIINFIQCLKIFLNKCYHHTLCLCVVYNQNAAIECSCFLRQLTRFYNRSEICMCKFELKKKHCTCFVSGIAVKVNLVPWPQCCVRVHRRSHRSPALVCTTALHSQISSSGRRRPPAGAGIEPRSGGPGLEPSRESPRNAAREPPPSNSKCSLVTENLTQIKDAENHQSAFGSHLTE